LTPGGAEGVAELAGAVDSLFHGVPYFIAGTIPATAHSMGSS